MFTNYGILDFFKYKGLFAEMGYAGQDYNGYGRYIYLISSLIILIALWIIFIKAKKETIHIFIRVFAITLTSLYIIKTTWESYYDITIGPGFNEGLLPFDTCSIPMLAGFLAGFGKGKVKKLGESWLAVGNIVGGVSNLLFLRALNYYPYFSFGAFYSMFWHFIMVFLGVWMLITNYVELNFKTVLYAFILHMLFSIIVIPYDHIRTYDFMLYRTAGGAPLIEKLGDLLAAKGLAWITTIIMIIVYFALFAMIIYVTLGIKTLIKIIKGKNKTNEEVVKEEPQIENNEN